MTLEPTRYVLEDGGLLLYYESWLSPAEARDAFEELRRETPWKSESIPAREEAREGPQ